MRRQPAPPTRRATLAVAAALALGVVAACDAGTTTPAPGPASGTVSSAPSGPPGATLGPAPGSPPGSSPGSSASSPATGVPLTEVPSVDVSAVTELATGLDVPWAQAFLPDGRTLVTLRDSGGLVVLGPPSPPVESERTSEALPSELVTGPGANTVAELTRSQGESGLLGVAALAGPGGDVRVFVYLTTGQDNRVLSAPLVGTRLGDVTVVLDGIPRGTRHDGGRLAFGPDGDLYVTTGDTGDTSLAQDLDSLGGKILRIAPDGSVPADNPFPGSPVWSLGHRNVQGIGWAADRRMFASEFGQDTWDELNIVVPGGNYGWPDVEGDSNGRRGVIDPVATWTPRESSPSGIAVTSEGVYLAGLRGERLWRVPLRSDGVGEPQDLLTGQYGRLRAVDVAPDGSLWVLTGNTDGRGDARAGDDRLLRVSVSPSAK